MNKKNYICKNVSQLIRINFNLIKIYFDIMKIGGSNESMLLIEVILIE